MNRCVMWVLILTFSVLPLHAQTGVERLIVGDSIRGEQEIQLVLSEAAHDSLGLSATADSILALSSDSTSQPVIIETPAMKAYNDSLARALKLDAKRRWTPDPQRALWLALVLPGAGQIYNRKFWKLPIVYGGFVGCLYALSWNNQMYKDYSQAYLDVMDSNPNTKSYEQILPAGSSYLKDTSRLKDLLKRKKNTFRRWRDMSLFCIAGVYLISVVDAYIDASLSEFDISKDLSLKVTPEVMNGNPRNFQYTGGSLGVRCLLKF